VGENIDIFCVRENLILIFCVHENIDIFCVRENLIFFAVRKYLIFLWA
jgi:hypothetical protein